MSRNSSPMRSSRVTPSAVIRWNGGSIPTSTCVEACALHIRRRRRGKCGCCSEKRRALARASLQRPAGPADFSWNGAAFAWCHGVEYLKIDDAGLHVRIDQVPEILGVDTVVVCAGQEPRRELADELLNAKIPHSVIGGADVTVELDAKRAIAQGSQLVL